MASLLPFDETPIHRSKGLLKYDDEGWGGVLRSRGGIRSCTPWSSFTSTLRLYRRGRGGWTGGPTHSMPYGMKYLPQASSTTSFSASPKLLYRLYNSRGSLISWNSRKASWVSAFGTFRVTLNGMPLCRMVCRRNIPTAVERSSPSSLRIGITFCPIANIAGCKARMEL